LTASKIVCSNGFHHNQDFFFMTESAFESHCDICEPTKEAALKAFCDIVQVVYEFVVPEPQPEHPLVAVLLKLVDQDDSVSILGNTQQLLLVKASEKIAEFGLDLLLQLLKKTGGSEKNEDGGSSSTMLYIGTVVLCPNCDEPWSKVKDGRDDAHCPLCGHWLEHWTEREEY
jgi:hypothetical protein